MTSKRRLWRQMTRAALTTIENNGSHMICNTAETCYRDAAVITVFHEPAISLTLWYEGIYNKSYASFTMSWCIHLSRSLYLN